MRVQDLAMPCFNTTLLGVIRGVLDYFGLPAGDALAFGGSGHAFLINVHEQLCPSGPYCWRYDEFFRLVGNLGVAVTHLGSFGGESSTAERAAVEGRLRHCLDDGIPCSVMNMENQLIVGYDDAALLLAQPWGDDCGGVTPARLSYGSWVEFGDELHAAFLAFEKQAPRDLADVVVDSLRHAVDLFRRPDRYAWPGYGIGPRAYDNWLAAIEEHGTSHGNWWNAQVWSECRAMAGHYFAEIADGLPTIAAQARRLARDYAEIASGLARLGDRQLAADEKRAIVADTKAREEAAVEGIEALLPTFELP